MEKLQRWSLIAEIVGGIAVVLSIVYLAVEVQRNTNAIQSQTQQGLLELVAEDNMVVAANAELADLYVRAQKDLASLTEVERERYKRLVTHAFTIWEQAFLTYTNGTMEEQTWLGWNRGYRFLVCNESSSQIWKEIEVGYPESRVHINELTNVLTDEDCE